MKILVLVPGPPWRQYNTSDAAHRAVSVLVAQNHDVHVLAYRSVHHDEFPTGCTVHDVGLLSRVSNLRRRIFWKHMVHWIGMTIWCLLHARRDRYDLVHALNESVCAAAVCKWLHGIPFIYEMNHTLDDAVDPTFVSPKQRRPSWFARLCRYVERTAMASSRGIIVNHVALEETAANRVPKVPVVCIENSVPTYRTKHDVWPCSENDIGFLYVSDAEFSDGIRFVLDAFVLLFYQQERAHLVVVSQHEADIRKYTRLAGQFGVTERTHFLHCLDVGALDTCIARADVLVAAGRRPSADARAYSVRGKPILAAGVQGQAISMLQERESLTVQVFPSPLDLAIAMDSLVNRSELRDRLAKDVEWSDEEPQEDLMTAKFTLFYEDVESNVCQKDLTSRRMLKQPADTGR